MLKKRVLVALSGGVDSSVTALLLQEQGYEAVGVTMQLFHARDLGLPPAGAAVPQGAQDAAQVAARLGLEHHLLDCSACFKKYVLERFASEYNSGRTPNPCIYCNKYLKFGYLMSVARELHCDYLATGHYAAIEYQPASGRWLLARAADAQKDQSYMLFQLTQEQLARVLLPLGALHKAQVRELAQAAGLGTAQKSDSQDICFVPDGDYAALIERLDGAHSLPGPFVHLDGTVLGQHRGQIRYTIGQRKGLGIAYAHPLYVIRKEAAGNRIILGPEAALYRQELLAENCNFISCAALTAPLRVTVQTRYHQQDVPAVIEAAADGAVRVRFDAPQRAITPGQAVVFYAGKYVVGGGTIAAAR